MAAVVQGSASNHAYVAGTTGVGVTHGFTLANGDVLYAFCAQGDDTGGSFSCSGWTGVSGATATSSGNDLTSHVLRKVITDASGEASSYTFVVSGNAGIDNICVLLVQVRGANTTTPEKSVATPTTGANDFTPDNADPADMGASGDVVLAFHVASGDASTLAAKTGGAPSGYSLVGSAIIETGGTAYECLIEVASANGGSSAPGVWTGSPDDSTSEWHTHAIVVAAAGGGSSASAYYAYAQQ